MGGDGKRSLKNAFSWQPSPFAAARYKPGGFRGGWDGPLSERAGRVFCKHKKLPRQRFQKHYNFCDVRAAFRPRPGADFGKSHTTGKQMRRIPQRRRAPPVGPNALHSEKSLCKRPWETKRHTMRRVLSASDKFGQRRHGDQSPALILQSPAGPLAACGRRAACAKRSPSAFPDKSLCSMPACAGRRVWRLMREGRHVRPGPPVPPPH